MTEVPKAGSDAGSDSIPENPALTGGVFRSSFDDPHETIAALIDGGDDSDAVEAENTSPRSWGFDVEEINRSYALAIWGGKAVVVNEQPSGPVNDWVRVMSFESMNSWFANRYTEIVGSDGKISPVTWAKAWHQHRDRRQYDSA